MPVSVTYREIAERFGIGIEGARLKAKRRSAKGLWRIVPGNHPQDVVRVEVPEDEWANPNVSRPTPPTRGHLHAPQQSYPHMTPNVRTPMTWRGWLRSSLSLRRSRRP
jgi:hypothetical protein